MEVVESIINGTEERCL